MGRVSGLPNTLSVGDFTANAMALDDLPTRLDTGWFFGVSIGVGSLGGVFSAPFETNEPEDPQAAQ